MTRLLRDPVILALAGGLIALVLLEATVFGHYSPTSPWHHVPGYAAIIGLGACLVVVIATKALGKGWLQRVVREDEDD
jgi:hypothetical protein